MLPRDRAVRSLITPVGDLLVGQPFRDQAQHLELALRQRVGGGGPVSGIITCIGKENEKYILINYITFLFFLGHC